MDPITLARYDFYQLAMDVYNKKLPCELHRFFRDHERSFPAAKQHRLMMEVQRVLMEFYSKDLSKKIKKGLAARRRRLRMATKQKVGG